MVAINEIHWVVSLIDGDETRILRGRGIGPWLKPGAGDVKTEGSNYPVRGGFRLPL
jgi:hypothetical protein